MCHLQLLPNPRSLETDLPTDKKGSNRVVVWVATVYFVAMALAVTFPGVVPFNTIRPFVLGIPFVFAWYLIWIAGSLVVFFLLHRTFSK
ncbi:MAG: hypothetical protein ACE5HT_04055 [Gemmatimonadales bacterium]